MQIDAYLPLFLLINQKVGLKGIGTITLRKFNGFHENETSTLYPPSVHLIFDEKFTTENDFVKYISEYEKINLDEANLMLDNWLQNIRAELDKGNHFVLNKIGSFKYENKKIQFTSSNHIFFNQANFGFKPIGNIVLNDDVFLNAIEEEANTTITPLNIIPSNNQKSPVLTLNNTNSEPAAPEYKEPVAEVILLKNTQEEKKIKQKKDWFWIFAIIIVCLTGAIVCATFIYFPPLNPEILETPLKQNKKLADSLAGLEIVPDTVVTYNIIVAENLTPLKAQKQLLKLKEIGIYGSLITNDSTINVEISAIAFFNLDSAKAKLKEIQNKYYPKAYLKTQKLIN